MGTVSLGASQRPQRHLCQPATFLDTDPAIIPRFLYEIWNTVQFLSRVLVHRSDDARK